MKMKIILRKNRRPASPDQKRESPGKGNPRQLATTILDRVDTEQSFAEPLLDTFLSQNILSGSQDKRLLTELVYGTLRMRNRLDWHIESTYTGDINRMEGGIKNILRVGLYQIIFTDRIPVHAAVDESVKLARQHFPGREGLVNAILRNAIRHMNGVQYPDREKDQASFISVFHSHPRWLVERWIGQYGTEETVELCKHNNERPPLTLRINRLKTTRSDAVTALAHEGITARPTAYSPDGIIISSPGMPVKDMSLYRKGNLLIQDEASQIISLLLDPRPGDVVLDACAGMGIKTTHIAGIMNNRGNIIALDILKTKTEGLKTLSERLGTTIIEPVTGDATKDMGPSYRERFDRIIVDAPCSALGTLRRNPEIKWNRKTGDMRTFPPLQKAMLDRCAAYLKRGGIMAYSTCTIDRDENEEMVHAFLREHTDFSCLYPSLSEAWGMIDENGFFRTFPHRHGTDGFFGALLIKKKGES